jgi:hypothetical protein
VDYYSGVLTRQISFAQFYVLISLKNSSWQSMIEYGIGRNHLLKNWIGYRPYPLFRLHMA